MIGFGELFSRIFTVTVTVAGAVGALGEILISWATGRLIFTIFRTSLMERLMNLSSLFLIGGGAAMFTRFIGITGLGGLISSAVNSADLSYGELMSIVVVIYLILGMFMVPFGTLLITFPVLLDIPRRRYFTGLVRGSGGQAA
ncbi:MAG: TRAP-type C4-dicarboxylate transport system permease large subunit [Paracoccaceae bacterium]